MLDRFSKNPFINFKIILDCDDVLFGCNEQAIQKLNKEKGTSYKMSDITSWGTHNTGIDERLKYFADPKFVKNQPVYPGAQEFVHKLSKKAEVVIATNVPAQCASVRINVIVKNFPEIKISNILIGARKDLLNADMMLDDAPQNLDGANTRYPVLFRQPRNYGKTGLLSVSTYAEYLTLVDLIRTSEFADYDANEKPEVIVLVGPSGSGKKKLADELCLYSQIDRVFCYTTKPSPSYYNVTPAEFEAMKNKFFETSSYMGYRYGTKLKDIHDVLYACQIPLLIMDINGMLAVKSRFKTLAVFVKASKEDCIRDILMRDKENCNTEEMVRRIASIDMELLNEEFCDITVTCNDADTILERLR